MSDEVVFDGVRYISSKRASSSSGYTQDYIGQLARGGKIHARRVGGLWYVKDGELEAHKEAADRLVPTHPENPRSSDLALESIVSFDGREYVSAARAARHTGYHQDYIGQLARGGKVISRQIGNRWYVDLEALKQHKSEKDSLLAAVQAESVGLLRSEAQIPAMTISSSSVIDSPEGVHYTYIREEKDLLPVPEGDSAFSDPREPGAGESDEAFRIPIRVEHETFSQVFSRGDRGRHSSGTILARRVVPFSGVFVGIVAVVMIAVSVGVLSLRAMPGGVYTNVAPLRSTASSASAMQTVIASIRALFTKTLIYQRE